MLRTIDYSSTGNRKKAKISDYMNQFYNENVSCIKINKCKREHILYIGYENGNLIKWNIDQNDLAHDFGNIHNDMINLILIVNQHEENVFITVGYDRVMKMYDNAKHKLIHNFDVIHSDIIQDVIYYRDTKNHDLKYLITASEDKSIKIFNFSTKELLQTFDNQISGPISLEVFE